MNTLIKSSVIVLTAAVPVTFIAQFFGLPYMSEAVTEGTFAAFSSVCLLLIMFADYARRQPRARFVAKEPVRAVPKPQLKRPSSRQRQARVPSLTGIR